MMFVYVAGPFAAPTREGVEVNIARATVWGIEVAKLGAFPVVPHSNTASPEYEKVQPNAFWLEGTRGLLRMCNAIFMTPGWRASKGSVGEHRDALKRKMPVFENLAELDAWLKEIPF